MNAKQGSRTGHAYRRIAPGNAALKPFPDGDPELPEMRESGMIKGLHGRVAICNDVQGAVEA
jgi:hypothetical protein